ncbi:MAG TPA: hypothetical protein VGM43_24355 [Bryobacteraceae bacterium]|jgi:hypothetical protein
MADENNIEILTQSTAVDISELEVFLKPYAQTFAVTEIHPGPQASVDWFLPPNLEVVIRGVTANPFIASFLGVVSAHLTTEFAKRVLEKAVEKFGDAIIDKAAEGLWERVIKVFRRSKEHNVSFSRSGKSIPVPPLKLTLSLPQYETIPETKLCLVFAGDMSDADLCEAYHSVGKVIEVATKKLEDRQNYETRIQKMVAEDDMDAVTDIIQSPGYIELRRSRFTYVYRPHEKAWVEAETLAVQHVLEDRLASIDRMIANGKFQSSDEGVQEMISEIKQQIESARVR